MEEAYTTSFCNKPHCLYTGKPISHECFIIPVQVLELEMIGDMDAANDIMQTATLQRHRGLTS